MTANSLRIALIGIGKIAHDQHFPTILADPRFRLVATASRTGSIEGIRAYRTLQELLAAGPALDAVSICTPPVARRAIAEAAIDAGLDVMLEKPPAATLSDVAAIEARAAARGAVLFATWHSREAAGVAAARDWLAGRVIERIAIFWREDIRRWHPNQDWILAAGGFGIFDPGINALSIATAILADPLVIEAAEMRVPDGRQAPLSASLHMRCGTAPATAEFDFLHHGAPQWDILVDTNGGRLELVDGGRQLRVGGATLSGPDQEYPRLYAHFSELVRARRSDADTAPLRLVADAFLVASRTCTAPFTW